MSSRQGNRRDAGSSFDTNAGDFVFDAVARPEVIKYKKKKYKVPPVFLSGNHADIEKRRSK